MGILHDGGVFHGFSDWLDYRLDDGPGPMTTYSEAIKQTERKLERMKLIHDLEQVKLRLRLLHQPRFEPVTVDQPMEEA